MAFTELDPDVVWKLIEGYQNELSPETTKLESFYRQFRCPRCKSPCGKEYQAEHAFADPDTLVPRALLRCKKCDCLINPHVMSPSGEPMIVELGGKI